MPIWIVSKALLNVGNVAKAVAVQRSIRETPTNYIVIRYALGSLYISHKPKRTPIVFTPSSIIYLSFPTSFVYYLFLIVKYIFLL